MIFVSSCPALPTNGSPCSSSSAPGASPTNMSGESMLPTPKTTFLREEARCEHLTHAITRARNAANAAALAGSEEVKTMVGTATGEAAGELATTGVAARGAAGIGEIEGAEV